MAIHSNHLSKNTDALHLTLRDSSFIYLGCGFVVVILLLNRVQIFATH